MNDELNRNIDGETEKTFEELYNETMKPLHNGTIVDGTIVKILPNEVLIDIGYKAEGAVSLDEFDDPATLKLGDSVRVVLESTEDHEGVIQLSKIKADFIEAWEKLEKCLSDNVIIKGTVKKRVKGGYIVNIGVPAFLPASQIDTKMVKDLDAFVGQKIDIKILKMNKKRRNIVVSRRVVLEERVKKAREDIDNKIHVGAVLRGKVKNITDFGAFIDLGGIDGLLHVNDITWGKVAHPSEKLQVGEEVTVKVLDFDEKNNKISLSLKALEANPWDSVTEQYKEGDIIDGRIVSLVEYGAFVEVVPGVEGLVHISEMSWNKNIKNPSQIVKEGDVIKVKILKMEPNNRKISLGMKQVEEDPWTLVLEKYKEGDVITGEVKNVTDFGAFIEIETGIEGLLHVSDIAWERIEKPQDIVKNGQKIEVKILKFNPSERKISLGMKQLLPDPWDAMDNKYNVGDTVNVKIIRITKSNAICKMENGVEGFLAISQLDEDRVEKIEDIVKIGDEVSVKIIKILKNERKVDFSLKAAKSEEIRDAVEAVNQEAETTKKKTTRAKKEAPAAENE